MGCCWVAVAGTMLYLCARLGKICLECEPLQDARGKPVVSEGEGGGAVVSEKKGGVSKYISGVAARPLGTFVGANLTCVAMLGRGRRGGG